MVKNSLFKFEEDFTQLIMELEKGEEPCFIEGFYRTDFFSGMHIKYKSGES